MGYKNNPRRILSPFEAQSVHALNHKRMNARHGVIFFPYNEYRIPNDWG